MANTYQGAELMSWPPSPVSITKGKKEVKKADISFVISFKLQTYPWQSQPVIVPQLSIRRWFSEPLKKIPYGGATAYVGDNRRWLDGERQPFCFMRLATKRWGKEFSWHRAIANLLKINDTTLPEPSTLANNPITTGRNLMQKKELFKQPYPMTLNILVNFPAFLVSVP